MTLGTAPDLVRSALFVDFDNVYISLKNLDPAAADAFARNPARWLHWLESWSVGDGSRRRFLSRSCYLNPKPHGEFRTFYTSAGFRVVDCPSLTKQAKNSADISMVIDALDLLAHPVHYDEFIIMSADADFTPLLVRLRSHDRASVVVAAGPTSAAYRAVSDSYVSASDLVLALTEPAEEPLLATAPDARPAGTPVVPAVTTTAQEAAGATSSEAIDRAAQAIREALAGSAGPLPGASAGGAAVKVEPSLAKDHWGGAQSLSAFVEKHLPDVTLVRDNRGGWLLDPARHTVSDIPRPLPEDSIEATVAKLADIPTMTGEQYRGLFVELADDLETYGRVTMTRTPTRVRDAAAAHGVALTLNGVRRVLQGPVAEGMFQPGMSSDDLAQAFLSYVFDRSEAAGVNFTDPEYGAVQQWLTGTSAPAVPEPAPEE